MMIDCGVFVWYLGYDGIARIGVGISIVFRP